MIKFIVTDFLTPRFAAPLPVDAYLRRVLIPALAVLLIADDQKYSRNEAGTPVVDSRAFGKALHATSEEQDAFVKAELGREEKDKRPWEKKRVVEEKVREKERNQARRRKETDDAETGEQEATRCMEEVSTKLETV